ncbi:hypothetical protein C8R45DRAFT_1117032 [Mycena sanguinolenta]|nr:hypothetical protein C8R45DRAFT_1117032 [Mycena sanguinolenta]
MSPPPAKRRRTTTPIKHSELWFSDGGVVLQAENIQFRVHFGVLARHSSVFSDMQELPQPSDEPTVDGCPVVELQDDPTDVEFLLKALYDSQKIIPLRVLGAFIRLGRKYDFKDLLRSAVERVTAEYPRILEKYLAVEDKFETIHENKIFTALPLAYYRAVQVTTVDFYSTRHSELFEENSNDGGTCASLSELDRGRCVMGRHTLLVKQFEQGYTFGWLRKWEFTDCTSPVTCRSSRESKSQELTRGYQIWAVSRRIILTWGHGKFCPACTRHAKECSIAGREKTWQEVPEIFGLPPWNQLENDL